MGSINYNSHDRHKIRRRLSGEQNHRCCLCGWSLGEPPIDGLDISDWIATFEHVIPRHQGGKDYIVNLAISHKICNKMRGRWDRTDYQELTAARADSI